MSETFEVTNVAAQPTVTVRFRSAVQDLPQHMDPAYGRLFGYLGKIGEPPAGAPFSVYHTMDMQDLDVEVGVPIARPVASAGEVIAAELPARRVATGVLTGSYDGLPGFYERLSTWCAEQGHRVTSPAVEHYLNDPSKTPEAQLQTRVELTLAD